MAVGTKIEWTHRPGTIPATMNALVGCQKVSDGCRGCYAINTAHVRAGNPLPVMQQKFAGTTKREGGKTLWTGKVTLSEEALLAPLCKKKPHTYFVNSMSDLFYDGVPDEWIDRHFAVFALCPQHTFIVLTKRPERMRSYVTQTKARMSYGPPTIVGRQSAIREQIARLRPMECLERDVAISAVSGSWETGAAPLSNVWLGVSVENQKTADERIPLLLQTPAAVRFLSCEPLLGPVELHIERNGVEFSRLTRNSLQPSVDWVIAGGESGRNARPMHPDWARSLRDQCAAAGVPFFFKQWGEWQDGSEYRGRVENRIVMNDGRSAVNMDGLKLSRDDEHEWSSFSSRMMARVGKKHAGDLLDGVQHHAFPEVR